MAITFEQITSVLGPIGADVAAAIAATDASLAELEEAWAWLQNDEALVYNARHMPTGKVAELIEILSPTDEEEQPS